jgi:hypothetical protein
MMRYVIAITVILMFGIPVIPNINAQPNTCEDLAEFPILREKCYEAQNLSKDITTNNSTG